MNSNKNPLLKGKQKKNKKAILLESLWDNCKNYFELNNERCSHQVMQHRIDDNLPSVTCRKADRSDYKKRKLVLAKINKGVCVNG